MTDALGRRIPTAGAAADSPSPSATANSQTPRDSGSSAWTPQQKLAIETTGGNLLVSAAAGTGKTSVLVERIIRLVTSPHTPVDIERFLVVTFTEKAAQEMKARIRSALEKIALENPESSAARQADFVERAQISTIHAFCLRVLRRYFHQVDLDPSFRVLDSAEADLLRRDALDAVFEETYAAQEATDSVFRGLVQRYGGAGIDEGLKDLVLNLHNFAATQPAMEDWFAKALSFVQEISGAASIWDLHWTRSLCKSILLQIDRVISFQEEARQVCLLPGGPWAYLSIVAQELEFYLGIREDLESLASGDFHEAQTALARVVSYKHQRLPAAKDTDLGLREQAQAMRNAAKAEFGKLRDYALARPAQEVLEELKDTAPFIECLADLVLRLDRRYGAKKRERRGLDFSDLERLCLQVLTQEDGGAARQLQSEYDYVLVDEYQDTNPIQEAILSRVVRTGERANFFMVGDIKQSIYRFRLAEPGIFLKRHKTYEPMATSAAPNPESSAETGKPECLGNAAERTGGVAPSQGARLDLSVNFRSRREVVDAVNWVFDAIMREQPAEIDYDQSHRLVLGASYPEPGDTRYAAEFHLVEREQTVFGDEPPQSQSQGQSKIDQKPGPDQYGQGSDQDGSDQDGWGQDGDSSIEDYEAVEKEAMVVAARIKHMVTSEDPLHVCDSKSKTLRKCSYRDIAILMRSTKDRANAVLEVLSRCGIPAYADTATGYFQAREIEVALSILSIIDNPRQDIPLAAVLRSPVVGLTPEDLAVIRCRRQEGSFYDAVKDYSRADERVGRFLETLDGWRTMARRKPLAEVLWTILHDTGYEDYVGGLPGGAQRQANLQVLCDRARQFDTFGHHGLFRFLRFVEKLQESEGDLGAARALGEQEDAVRILSIHKSKGLEFPVVFVMDLGKRFNTDDTRREILFHKDLGIAALYCDLAGGAQVKYPSLAHQAISLRLWAENLAEEMRVLYVALTRAKEKLCLVGSARKLQGCFEKWRRQDLCGAATYLDWLCPVILGDDAQKPFAVTTWGTQDGCPVPLPEVLAGLQSEDAYVHHGPYGIRPLPPHDPEIYGEVKRRLEWQYPYLEMTNARAKISVGELKRRIETQDEEDAWRYLPRPQRRMGFDDSRGYNQGILRGIAIHTVLSKMDLARAESPEGVAHEVTRLVDLGFLDASSLSQDDASLIAAFFQTDLGRALVAWPERVHKEVPFTMKMPARLVSPTGVGDGGDEILVQGVIDVILEEDDGVTILDYKTDAVSVAGVSETANRYASQVSLYALAAEDILHRPVKGVWIAFLEVGSVVPVDWRGHLASRGLCDLA